MGKTTWHDYKAIMRNTFVDGQSIESSGYRTLSTKGSDFDFMSGNSDKIIPIYLAVLNTTANPIPEAYQIPRAYNQASIGKFFDKPGIISVIECKGSGARRRAISYCTDILQIYAMAFPGLRCLPGTITLGTR
jgi:hypothetical protein